MKRSVTVALVLLAIAGIVQIALMLWTGPVGASVELAIVLGAVLVCALAARLVLHKSSA